MASGSLNSRLSGGLAVVKGNIQSVLVGVLVFGLLMGVVQHLFNDSVASIGMSIAEKMGYDVQSMQELGERAREGDEAAARELEEMMASGFGEQFEGMEEEEVLKHLWTTLMSDIISFVKTIILMFLLTSLVKVLSLTYYQLLAIRKSNDAFSLLSDTAGVALPMLGLSIWIFLRSFLWIPILGWFIAIFIGPRFALAPYLYLTQRKGVFAAASDSYVKTSGYWGTIVGNMFIAALVSFLPLLILAGILNMIVGPFAGLYLTQIILQFASAFVAAVSVLLAMDILNFAPASAPAPSPTV